MDKIYQMQWINLSKEMRQHLAKVFGLVATGIAEIRDQTVISDGYSNEDLSRITKEKMIEYVGSASDTTESFGRLWEITISKVNSELHPPVELKIDPIVNTVPPTPPENMPKIDEPKKWCDSCESKGVRHRKECSKFIPFPNTFKK